MPKLYHAWRRDSWWKAVGVRPRPGERHHPIDVAVSFFRLPGSGEVEIPGESVPMLSVQPKGKQKGCAGCNRKIKDRYLLKALDQYWHEDCLKCACCDCRLGEVGSTLYTKANLILCRRDYLRLFGTTGNCAACSKLIPAFEMVMRARDNVYHLDCFACQLCNQRFCVGDKFFLKNNMILCQMDYEEGQLNGTFDSHVQ
uniref:LIM domain only 1 n=1 Tax=Bos taurus TaxID=9913 RepID=A0AAA9TIE8_BOVIN